MWAHVAITVGDEVLRRRAFCVTWIEPTPVTQRPQALCDRTVDRADRAVLAHIHSRHGPNSVSESGSMSNIVLSASRAISI
jgi:NADH:ubiquinone oxidoreductase subunit H